MDGWMDGAIGVLPGVGAMRHSHAHDTSHTHNGTSVAHSTIR